MGLSIKFGRTTTIAQGYFQNCWEPKLKYLDITVAFSGSPTSNAQLPEQLF
jgi:hypothetical protein